MYTYTMYIYKLHRFTTVYFKIYTERKVKDGNDKLFKNLCH